MDLKVLLGISIAAILFGIRSNFSAFYNGNWINESDKIEGLIVTSAFLVVWLFYGIVRGLKKNVTFLKFNSLYWVIGGIICLITYFIPHIGNFIIVIIPVYLLIMVPAYWLRFFYTVSSNTLYLVPIVGMITSWLAGTIGYLLGYLLNKLGAPHTKSI